jgi:hypothetical protein
LLVEVAAVMALVAEEEQEVLELALDCQLPPERHIQSQWVLVEG